MGPWNVVLALLRRNGAIDEELGERLDFVGRLDGDWGIGGHLCVRWFLLGEVWLRLNVDGDDATVLRKVDRATEFINRVSVSVTEGTISVIDDDIFVGDDLSSGLVNEWLVVDYIAIHVNWLSIGIDYIAVSVLNQDN